MSTCYIIGADSMLGSRMASRMLHAGWQVIALIDGPSPSVGHDELVATILSLPQECAKRLPTHKLSTLEGSRTVLDYLEPIAHSWDSVVIHIAAENPLRDDVADRHSQQSSETTRVLRFAQRCGNGAQLMLVNPIMSTEEKILADATLEYATIHTGTNELDAAATMLAELAQKWRLGLVTKAQIADQRILTL